MNNIRKLYSALYDKPLYDIISDGVKSKLLRTIILGDGNDALNCFKTIFWCGQLAFSNISYRLEITVISENPDMAMKSYAEIMPALFEYSLAHISFKKKQGTFYKTAASLSENSVCIFDYSDETPDLSVFADKKNIRIYLPDKKTAANCSNVEIVNMLSGENKELEELAFAVDFGYALSFDPRADKSEKRKEFFQPHNEYNRKSSFANALHIKYKTYCAGIKWFSPYNDPEIAETISCISDVIRKKSNVYNTLIKLEHTRWVAYMISEGYSSPSDEELEQYAFNYYNDGNKKTFIASFKNNVFPPYKHPCITPCENGIVLSKLSKKQWDKLSDKELNRLDGLDKVSVKLHRLAAKKSDAYRERIWELINELAEDVRIYRETTDLKIIAEMLYNQNVRAEQLWDKNINAIKEKILDTDKLIEKVNDVNNLIQVVKERNLYHDYKASNDISNLPYIIYSAKPYKTLIKFYSEEIISNVASASVLLPDKVVFFGVTRNNPNFVLNVTTFFKSRHIFNDNTLKDNMRIYFCDSKSVEEICSRFYSYVEKNNLSPEDCVIDITDTNPNFSAAAGNISTKTGIPLIRFDNNNGVRNVSNGGKLCFVSRIPKVSIDELYGLLNCSERFSLTHNDALSLNDIISKLSCIFEEYNDVWPSITEGIRTFKSDVVLFERTPKYVSENLNNKIKRYEGTIPSVIFWRKELDGFLYNLERLGIISDLSIITCDNANRVMFNYYDDVIIDKAINSTEVYPITFKYQSGKVKFIQHSLKAVSVKDIAEINPVTQKVLRKAEQYGLIRNLHHEKIDGTQRLCYEYINTLVKKALTVDGALLELLVYYRVFESGYFDDIKNNFEFMWDQTENTEVENPIKRFIGIAHFNSSLYNASDNPVKNEIDIVVAKNFKIKLISCKAGKVKQLDLMQVHYLSKCFGKYGDAILAYSNDSTGYDSIHKRAQDMKIDIISPDIIFRGNNELIEKVKRNL